MSENYKQQQIIKSYRHEPGVHCTSSAVRDVFEFYGWKMSEAMIFGLASGMTLAYLKIPKMTPFFGGRNKDFVVDLCSTLKVSLNEFTTKNEQEGWNRLKQHLNSEIPVVINIDMGFLKYQTDLQEDYHFGGHTIAVCGYNPEDSSVVVSDTHFPDLLRVTYEELAKGRNSTYDRFMAPNNLIYEFDFPNQKPELSVIIEDVLNRTGKNLLSKSGRILRLMGIHSGITAIDVLIKDLNRWLKQSSDKLKFRCIQQAGYIGTKTHNYGTGGGLFRYLFAEFLQEIAQELNNSSLKRLAEFYEKLGERWEEIAIQFSQLGEDLSTSEQVETMNSIRSKLTEIKNLEEEGATKLLSFKILGD